MRKSGKRGANLRVKLWTGTWKNTIKRKMNEKEKPSQERCTYFNGWFEYAARKHSREFVLHAKWNGNNCVVLSLSWTALEKERIIGNAGGQVWRREDVKIYVIPCARLMYFSFHYAESPLNAHSSVLCSPRQCRAMWSARCTFSVQTLIPPASCSCAILSFPSREYARALNTSGLCVHHFKEPSCHCNIYTNVINFV